MSVSDLKVYWAVAASGLRWEERSSWGRTWLGIWDLRGIKFLEIVSWGWCGWGKYVEQITLKLCLTILIEMKFWCRSWFRSSSRGSSSNNESHYVGNLVDINLTVIDRYMLEWWIVLKGTCVPGQSTQGKVPKRMLRGYTSLLREHREGENRIFWKEEEDFLGKHRRRFTSRALPRARCHNQ